MNSLVGWQYSRIKQITGSFRFVGNSLLDARYYNSLVARDFTDISRKLSLAQNLASPGRKLYDAETELRPVVDLRGKIIGSVPDWQAHQLGIRHITSNVILILPDGKVLLQKRPQHKYLFPGGWGLSAGGHMTISGLNSVPPSPLDTAMRELAEELNLNLEEIDRRRFILLGERPIRNFLRTYKYEKSEVEGLVVQFDEKGRDIVISVRKGEMNQVKQDELLSVIRRGANYPGLSVNITNVELCYYFGLPVTEAELNRINIDFGTERIGSEVFKEVAGRKEVTLEEMISAGRDLKTATDNLYSLFYGHDIVASHLRRIVSSRSL